MQKRIPKALASVQCGLHILSILPFVQIRLSMITFTVQKRCMQYLRAESENPVVVRPTPAHPQFVEEPYSSVLNNLVYKTAEGAFGACSFTQQVKKERPLRPDPEGKGATTI